jgi:16S rRNA (cytidine1402-2'-O)-methyltransferase
MAERGSLVVVATPIGNLGDLSPRAAQALREADLIACEDTRRTGVLLGHAGVRTPMVALHAHNEAARTAQVVDRLRTGASVALVSDAGMPLVSDPGARLVRAALDAGAGVTVVPGPSAVTAALAISGLASGRGFAFAGFGPRRAAERAGLARELAGARVPTVIYESPRRLPALLRDLAAAMPDRAVAVCRELTKVHEEVVRGTAAEVSARFASPPKGEVVVVVAGTDTPAVADDAVLRDGVRAMLAAGSGAGGAADALAALGLCPRNRAYALALSVAEEMRASS